jgi:predicted nuclease with TOPRIM domain
MKVIKKDGRIEGFDKKKIEAAVARSGAKRYARKIADMVERKLSGQSEIPSSLIREMVIRKLQEYSKRKAQDFANFQKKIRRLSSNENNLENLLRSLVGKNGEVEAVYGGFRITVKNPEVFDYFGVLHEILKNSNFSISVELEEGLLVIIAK